MVDYFTKITKSRHYPAFCFACFVIKIDLVKNTITHLLKEFQKHTNTQRAGAIAMFFKTAKGQYGYGDKFLGISVATTRAILKSYSDLPLRDIKKLLLSKWHEYRLAGAILLSGKTRKAKTPSERKAVCGFYFANIQGINNWDLVDVSAEHCVGLYLGDLTISQQKKFLLPLIKSQNIWERRIAMISTFHFIKQGKSGLSLWVAEKLLHDTHDLMHKAVGWMLREVGKRCGEKMLCEFLEQHASSMPRTALRYAIERLNAKKKQHFMNKKRS